ncbi:MAG: response regulator [Hylemonella sp.]|nr:response regulator [Hylemonella sp.]
MKKVLIIDDHATTRDLIKWALNESGLKLSEASNGEAGILAAKQSHPDLILLDIMMPGGLDGYAVCKQLRDSDTLAKVKIILLSANDAEADRKRGQEAGANAYLVKPFKPAVLRGVVNKLLEES